MRFTKLIILATWLVLLSASFALTGERPEVAPPPATKADGGAWRLGYLEGGPSREYVQHLRALVLALAERGWLEKPELPSQADPEDAHALWLWLADNARSRYVSFAKDGCYSSDWDDKTREENRRTVLDRLAKRKDVDLVLAMGTWAGQDLAAPGVKTPVEVLAASQPVEAQIVASQQDSGFDHLHAQVDPDQYRRQLRLFHDIVPFKRLGYVFEDTLSGRSYAAVSDLELVSNELGFELVPCPTQLDLPDASQARRNLLDCHKKLVEQKVDALYLTVNGAMEPSHMAELLAPLMAADVPTFSQYGSDEVRHGALLSIAQAEFKYVADFHARSIARMLSGTTPRKLPMLFEAPPNIAINLKTAEMIGFDPPFEILMGADEIYKDIETAP